jgi:lysophospholipase L1-like esterase
MTQNADMHWVGTWTTTPDPVEDVALAGQTVRMITRVSIGGSRARVRISNAYGSRPLAVGAAHVAPRSHGSGIVADDGRALTFAGARSIVIPPGALAVSDPVDVPVVPLTDLAVSVYLPDDLPAGSGLTGHDNGHQTNYISPPGDFTASVDFPDAQTTEAFLFVSGVEVLAGRDVGGIVTFGDSLTEGNISTLDANCRWPDQLARRLVAREGGRQLGVVNQGIGGNRMLHDGRGQNGLARFDRDVLAQPGVTHVVILMGINDLRNSHGRAEEIVTAEPLISGLHQMSVRARSAGVKVLCATLLPWEYETFRGGFYTPEGERARQAVNQWIRSSGDFDAVIDFDAALRDPDHPTRMLPRWDCGDHLHPNDAGYLQLGDCIDLTLFD